jgi:hypothetical protein
MLVVVIIVVPPAVGPRVNDPVPLLDVNAETAATPVGEGSGVANVPAKLDSEMLTVSGVLVGPAN